MKSRIWGGRFILCAVISLCIGAWYSYELFQVIEGLPSLSKVLGLCFSCMVSLGYTLVLADLGFGDLGKDPAVSPSKFAIAMGLMAVVAASGYNAVDIFISSYDTTIETNSFFRRLLD